MRNMVRPLNKKNLLEDACPMEDILGHIATQLAGYEALKEAQSSRGKSGRG